MTSLRTEITKKVYVNITDWPKYQKSLKDKKMQILNNNTTALIVSACFLFVAIIALAILLFILYGCKSLRKNCNNEQSFHSNNRSESEMNQPNCLAKPRKNHLNRNDLESSPDSGVYQCSSCSPTSHQTENSKNDLACGITNITSL